MTNLLELFSTCYTKNTDYKSEKGSPSQAKLQKGYKAIVGFLKLLYEA